MTAETVQAAGNRRMSICLVEINNLTAEQQEQVNVSDAQVFAAPSSPPPTPMMRNGASAPRLWWDAVVGALRVLGPFRLRIVSIQYSSTQE